MNICLHLSLREAVKQHDTAEKKLNETEEELKNSSSKITALDDTLKRARRKLLIVSKVYV